MANKVIYTPAFIRKARSLKKKHLSLTSDLEKLEADLIINPKQGVDLG
jgi:mRNA-degrading endonuclease RelE of RelBE toxin-antitoxin system